MCTTENLLHATGAIFFILSAYSLLLVGYSYITNRYKKINFLICSVILSINILIWTCIYFLTEKLFSELTLSLIIIINIALLIFIAVLYFKNNANIPISLIILISKLLLILPFAIGFLLHQIRKIEFCENSDFFSDVIYNPAIALFIPLLFLIMQGIDRHLEKNEKYLQKNEEKKESIKITNHEIKIDIPTISIQLKSKDISLSEECINENAEKSKIQQPTEQKSIEPQLTEPPKKPEKEQAESQTPK